MDKTYVEQLVKKETTMTQLALRTGAIVSGILITYILMVLIGVVALVAAFAIVYGIYYLFIMTDIEYEYTFVSGELNIDTVYGKNKRKQSGCYDIKKCELIAPYDSTYAAMYNNNAQMKTMDFTSGRGENEVYLMVAGYGAGNMRVYFEPNGELVEAMRAQAPGKVKK